MLCVCLLLQTDKCVLISGISYSLLLCHKCLRRLACALAYSLISTKIVIKISAEDTLFTHALASCLTLA